MNKQNKLYTAIKLIKDELFVGYDSKEKILFPLILMLQVVGFMFNPENYIGVITGISGILCVVMSTKSRITTYFWGFIQVSLYLYVSLDANFLGEVYLNVFYVVSQFIGLYVWKKNMKQSDDADIIEEVSARKLSKKHWVYNIIGMVTAWYLFTKYLTFFGSNNPPIDSITTTLSVFAQVHMVKRFSSQWILWILVNIMTVVLWSQTGNWSMVALWTGMLINSIYAYFVWNKKTEQETETKVTQLV